MATLNKMQAKAQARLIKLLLDGVHSAEELAQASGLHYVTVLQYTRELHIVGAAHIVAWRKDQLGRDCVKIYKLGVGKDVQRAKLTAAQRQAKHRAKLKAMKDNQ